MVARRLGRTDREQCLPRGTKIRQEAKPLEVEYPVSFGGRLPYKNQSPDILADSIVFHIANCLRSPFSDFARARSGLLIS